PPLSHSPTLPLLQTRLPGDGSILHKSLRYLADAGALSGRTIRALHLGPYFTVVELDDASVGACLSYYPAGFPDFQSARKEIEAAVVTDPLLLELLFGAGPPDRFSSLPHEQRRLLVQCLRATVVSALSAPLLRGGGDAVFSVSGS